MGAPSGWLCLIILFTPMFNLLPKEEQQIIAREYRLRLVAAGLVFLFLLWIVALIAIIPLFVLSYQKGEVALKSDEALKEDIASEAKNDPSNVLKISDKKVAALSAETPAFYIYELIAEIIQDRAPGVKISDLNFTRADGGGRNITIMGTARDRETLLAFAANLESIKNFTGVTVPVSDFAPVSDIHFSVTAKTKK